MAKYRHDDKDHVDLVIQALDALEKNEGRAAAKAALPDGFWPIIDKLMGIEKVGFITATEIALRVSFAQEAPTVLVDTRETYTTQEAT